MKEKKTDKRVYMEPVCESFAVEAEQLLQASGNAGMIGPGAGGGDAKQGWFEEEEEETASSDESKFGSPWED